MHMNKEIYPNGQNKNLKINSFAGKLCGKFRPGHFIGVVDVIDRFIKIINPNKIYLGKKDFQQLILIKDFIKKNKIKTKVISCNTIREKNGIALSSRNYLLSLKQKKIASKVYKLLKNKKLLIKNKNKLSQIKKNIYNLGVKKIDYLKILDTNKIIKPYKKIKKYRVFIAYYLGKTRLIDNI